jgi:hypothetical protein
MSVYAYRANNNNCRDGKIRIFSCNECGSINLKDPRDSESDHRDVLRFTCNNCGIAPYHHWMCVWDVIKVTNQNKEDIKREICLQNDKDPDEYKFAVDVDDE